MGHSLATNRKGRKSLTSTSPYLLGTKSCTLGGVKLRRGVQRDPKMGHQQCRQLTTANERQEFLCLAQPCFDVSCSSVRSRRLRPLLGQKAKLVPLNVSIQAYMVRCI